MSDLIDWLAKKLERAFPNIKPEQIQRKSHSVSLTFIVTGNEVDVVPIRYSGDPDWRGLLISQETGDLLMTSVPMHLSFIRARKQRNDRHYAQVVRLMKFWADLRKQEDANFRFKSFMIELLVAYLTDHGMPVDDYPEALATIFAFIAKDGFQTVIGFDDYYDLKKCVASDDPICIWDPVNYENNVAKLYTATNKVRLVEAALDAGDAIDAALRAPTKAETVRYWQKIFGPTFQ